jgi:hypothetical protein
MTKAAMILGIQKQEARLWLTLKEATRDFGADHAFTRSCRASYSAVYELMHELKIGMDHTLPDNVEASEVIQQINQEA